MRAPSSELPGSRFLVTGASGFIGSHLCARLRGGGHEVHGVSRVERRGDGTGLRWWQGDLADLATAQAIVGAVQPDVIFHLSGHVAGARDLAMVMPAFGSILASTVNLFTAATEIGCRRLVMAGSMEEPEWGDPEAVPSSPYAAAKWAGSAYARMFHALFRLPIVNLRIFMVYGPGQRDVQKLVPYVTLALLRGDSPKLTSGLRWVDWIFVQDVVDGLLAAARTPGLQGQTVDIGSGQLTQVRTVVERLARLIGPRIPPEFGTLADRPLEQTRLADVARSRALMGWGPTTTLDDGLEQTVNWYRAHASTQTHAPSS